MRLDDDWMRALKEERGGSMMNATFLGTSR
jgi:hypothetical protein